MYMLDERKLEFRDELSKKKTIMKLQFLRCYAERFPFVYALPDHLSISFCKTPYRLVHDIFLDRTPN